MAKKPKIKKPMTNVELVTFIMEFSKHGPLAQLFVMDALDKWSKRISNTKPEDYPVDGFIHPESWISVAKEIQEKLSNRE